MSTDNLRASERHSSWWYEANGPSQVAPAIGLDHYHRSLHGCAPQYQHTFAPLAFGLTAEDEAALQQSSSSATHIQIHGETPARRSDETASDASSSSSSLVTAREDVSGQLHERTLEDNEQLKHIAPKEQEQEPAQNALSAAPSNATEKSLATARHQAKLDDQSKHTRRVSLEEKLEGYLRKGFGRFSKQVCPAYISVAIPIPDIRVEQPKQVEEGQMLVNGREHVEAKLGRQRLTGRGQA